ncbi:C-type lectin domain family 4 member M-like [Pimephales promelas]|uniref:C-type lectin domain family 4 member M-like n=1 Tax=Pimephales promelas TaxID=90988 RepID=UPI0019556712|nr:C-type lectin domain family 4 member M-like [Pimephales promelas]
MKVFVISYFPPLSGSGIVRNRSPRAALVCVVLLCVFLLTAVIVLCVHIKTKSTNYTEETHQLLTKINNLTEETHQLLTKINNLTEETHKQETKINNLTEETHKQQTKINNLTEETHKQQTKINKLTEERDELLTRNMQLTKERDGLSSSNRDLIRDRNQLKKEKNDLSESLRVKDGWLYHKSSLYFLSTEKRSWTESRRYCTERGADLIIINNREEQGFVQKKYPNDKVWIGVTDSDVEGTWKWVDGSRLNSGFWASGEPNSYNGIDEDCAVNYDTVFADHPCNDAFKWICEKVILK